MVEAVKIGALFLACDLSLMAKLLLLFDVDGTLTDPRKV